MLSCTVIIQISLQHHSYPNPVFPSQNYMQDKYFTRNVFQNSSMEIKMTTYTTAGCGSRAV
jgi:hypothetical protein